MATHPKTLEELHRRHNMHTLSGNWRGRYECHVANAGDWLAIWSSNDSSVLAATTNYSGKPTLSESPASVLHIPYRQTDAYKPLTISLPDWDYSSCSESSIHSISRDSDSSVTDCNCSLSLPSPS